MPRLSLTSCVLDVKKWKNGDWETQTERTRTIRQIPKFQRWLTKKKKKRWKKKKLKKNSEKKEKSTWSLAVFFSPFSCMGRGGVAWRSSFVLDHLFLIRAGWPKQKTAALIRLNVRWWLCRFELNGRANNRLMKIYRWFNWLCRGFRLEGRFFGSFIVFCVTKLFKSIEKWYAMKIFKDSWKSKKIYYFLLT